LVIATFWWFLIINFVASSVPRVFLESCGAEWKLCLKAVFSDLCASARAFVSSARLSYLVRLLVFRRSAGLTVDHKKPAVAVGVLPLSTAADLVELRNTRIAQNPTILGTYA